MEKQYIAEQKIEQALLQGRWGLLERLPAERKLAEELGINRGTLRGALKSLAGRGIVETTRGSGTVVRAIPREGEQRSTGSIHSSMEAFQLLMPPVVAACVGKITPLHILELERLLPSAGVALRNEDMRGFAQAQLRFFAGIARGIGNPVIAEAVSQVLPEARSLVRLLQHCSQEEHERIFAVLARLLGAFRHADLESAVSAIQDYATWLLMLLEEKA